jgi:proline iminopeptidase
VGASECLYNRYGVQDYVADEEAIRDQPGIDRWHVFGHSWGGLLAQRYAAAHPAQVESLVLCNSALGIGEGWRRNQREVSRHNLRQSGTLGSVALIFWHLTSFLPGGLGDMGTRKVNRRAWRNYFLDPKTAPPPDEGWVRGVSAEATVPFS